MIDQVRETSKKRCPSVFLLALFLGLLSLTINLTLGVSEIRSQEVPPKAEASEKDRPTKEKTAKKQDKKTESSKKTDLKSSPKNNTKAAENKKAANKKKKLKKPCPSVAFFNSIPIVELTITLGEAEVEELYRAPRSYVKATVREGKKEYKDVGIHLKGRAGSFRHFHSRPALTLNFDKYVKKQRFHGMDKLHLNNSVQDRSYLNELVCGDLFRQAGIPAPRVAHAHVTLNDRDLGLYVLKEGFDRKFLKHYFKNTKGNLYDGGFLQEIDWGIDKKSGEGVDDGSDLEILSEASRIDDHKKREEALSKILDVDRFLRFIALEALTFHWDGYAMKRNNYKLYRDPTTKKFIFLPHGMDQMFERTHTPIVPWYQGMVADSVMEVPRWRHQYFEEVEYLLKKVMVEKTMLKRIAQVQKKLDPVLEKLSDRRASNQSYYAELFKDAIKERLSYIQTELGRYSEERKRLAKKIAEEKKIEKKKDKKLSVKKKGVTFK